MDESILFELVKSDVLLDSNDTLKKFIRDVIAVLDSNLSKLISEDKIELFVGTNVGAAYSDETFVTEVPVNKDLHEICYDESGKTYMLLTNGQKIEVYQKNGNYYYQCRPVMPNFSFDFDLQKHLNLELAESVLQN